MIADRHGVIEYAETGTGPTIVLVPGSCSTGAAWRAVIAALEGKFRCITTSLPGYGGTLERRTSDDVSIAHVAEAVETVAERAGAPVHLVGHSFGGLASLAVAVRKHISIASLTLIEPPAVTLLNGAQDGTHQLAFERMRDSYVSAYASGDREAIGTMIDFYGGTGTFASWPDKVRNYAIDTTSVNLLDWQSAYGFEISIAALAAMSTPVLIVRGSLSCSSMHRITDILAEKIASARLATIPGASHFSISTHPNAVAELVTNHALASWDGSCLTIPGR